MGAIRSVRLERFRSIFDAKLDLGRFTVLYGPDGSGKTNFLIALRSLREMLSREDGSSSLTYDEVLSVDAERGTPAQVSIEFDSMAAAVGVWSKSKPNGFLDLESGLMDQPEFRHLARESLRNLAVHDFRKPRLSVPCELVPTPGMSYQGEGLAAVLDSLRDSDPARFAALDASFVEAHPEFTGLRFETPTRGHRSLLFLRQDGRCVKASQASDGLLVALAVIACRHHIPEDSVLLIREPTRNLSSRGRRFVLDTLAGFALGPQAKGQVVITLQGESLPEWFDVSEKTLVQVTKSKHRTSFVQESAGE